MNKETIKEMITAIQSDSLGVAKQKFNFLMANKIKDIVDDKKTEFAKTYLKKKDS